MFDQWEVKAGLKKGEEPCELDRIYARYIRWCEKAGVTNYSKHTFVGCLRNRDYRVERNGAIYMVFLHKSFQKRGPRPSRPKPRCPCCNRAL